MIINHHSSISSPGEVCWGESRLQLLLRGRGSPAWASSASQRLSSSAGSALGNSGAPSGGGGEGGEETRPDTRLLTDPILGQNNSGHSSATFVTMETKHLKSSHSTFKHPSSSLSSLTASHFFSFIFSFLSNCADITTKTQLAKCKKLIKQQHTDNNPT